MAIDVGTVVTPSTASGFTQYYEIGKFVVFGLKIINPKLIMKEIKVGVYGLVQRWS